MAIASRDAFCQNIQLSPEAEISIITCGPWQGEVYSAFGHSAIRVFDPANRLDDAYNYGVFDFNQPNFYLNYTRGLLLFKLGVYAYPDFRNIYIYYNRSVTEQVLNLSQSQKQAVYDFLEVNARPENETYRYDYFYNNCATQVRDVFAKVLKDSIHFDGSFIKTELTIRQLTDLYLKGQPWGDLGIDICLGLPMDKKASAYEYMFLPDYIEQSFDHVTLKRGDTEAPIVREKRIVFTAQPENTPPGFYPPWVVFGVFLVIAAGLSAYDLRRKKLSRWFDFPVFGIVGMVGLLLLLLWLGTDHAAAAQNFNLLWALPTHVVVFMMYRKKSAPFLKKYFLLVSGLMVILLATWFILPQQLNNNLLLFVAALGCRAFTVYRLG